MSDPSTPAPAAEPPDVIERWLYLGRVEASSKKGKLYQMFVTVSDEPGWTPPAVADLVWSTPAGAHLFDGLVPSAYPGAVYEVSTCKGGSSVRTSGARAPKLAQAWPDADYRRALSARDHAVYSKLLGERRVKGQLDEDELSAILAPVKEAYKSLPSISRGHLLAAIVRIVTS